MTESMEVDPVDIDARRVVRSGLDRTVFVEAGAGAGKTRELVERIVSLVLDGVPLAGIAAITFTEKAAGELSDRIRSALTDRVAAGDPVAAQRCRRALDELDDAHFQTLHAFAESLLAAHPAGVDLPPVFEVVDEIEGTIDFEARWGAFVDDLLSGEGDAALMTVAYVLGAHVDRLHDLAVQFEDHWDLLVDPPAWLATADPAPIPTIDLKPVVAALDAVLDARTGCCRDDDKLLQVIETFVVPLRDDLLHAAGDGDLVGAVEALRGRDLRDRNRGAAGNWTGPTKADIVALLAEAEAVAHAALQEAALPVLFAVCARVRAWTLDGVAERRRAGRLRFHDLLVLARDLLATSPSALEAVRADVTHLLVDEFQDTDPLQVELAELIGADRPGAMFFVGDPKQSIYRFRRADMTVYRAVRERFESAVAELTTNFRSVEPVVEWVNAVFGVLLGGTPTTTQAPWSPLTAARPRRSDDVTRPESGPVVVLGSPVAGKVSAARLRELEAADIVATCRAAVDAPWTVEDTGVERPARLGDIAILLPTRTSLPAIERALDQAGLPYRIESRSLLWATQEVRDLIVTARAVDDPSDQVAVVAALRSPILACDDASLVRWRAAGGRWDPLAPLPLDVAADDPVALAMGALADWHRRRWDLAPDELIEAIVRERSVFALAYGRARQRESWHRTRFVIDQVRAFADRGGASLRRFVEWAERQDTERAAALETVVPEADDEAVRIMTVHAAKGLEFPIAVVAGLGSTAAVWRPATIVWHARTIELRIGRKAEAWETPGFAGLRAEEVTLEGEEQLRLLYVACTRACDHLVVSMWHHCVATVQDTSCLAARAWPAVAEASGLDLEPLAEAPPLVSRGPQTPVATAVAVSRAEAGPMPEPIEVWVAARDADIARATRRVVSATALAAADRELHVGAGGFGAAFGRAVHHVLQTVDLDGGAGMEGLAVAAAAAATAEGIAERAPDVVATVQAALASATVGAAVQSKRWWREVPIAAELDGVLVEGVVDLLYETPDGFVIVDYKTETAVERYEAQLATYAAVLRERVRVAAAMFLCVGSEGAYERALPDLDGAVAAARARLGRRSEPAA